MIKTKKVDIENIISKVEAYYELEVGSIRSHSRLKHISLARHIAMYLVRQETKLSYHEIADIFGKDHSSIIYAVQRVVASEELLAIAREILSEEAPSLVVRLWGKLKWF